MDPKIVNRDVFKVMGVIGHFDSVAEDHTSLWEKDFMVFHDQIKSLSTGEGYYGVCLGADHTRPMDILAGMVVLGATGAPAGVEVREVPAATQDMIKLGFDYYPPATTDGSSPMEVWLPVKKRGG